MYKNSLLRCLLSFHCYRDVARNKACKIWNTGDLQKMLPMRQALSCVLSSTISTVDVW